MLPNELFFLLLALTIIFMPLGHYFLLKYFLFSAGGTVPNLKKYLLVSYLIAVFWMAAVFVLSIFVLLEGKSYAVPVVVATYLIAFVFPFATYLPSRLKVARNKTVGITIVLMVLVWIVWQAATFLNAYQPSQYKEGDMSEISYGGIILVAPNGGESFAIGSPVLIKW